MPPPERTKEKRTGAREFPAALRVALSAVDAEFAMTADPAEVSAARDE